MKIIRNNAFETNSSSTHAIAIPENQAYTTPKKVYCYCGDYGWTPNKLEDVELLSYLYTALKLFQAKDYIELMFKWFDEDSILYECEPKIYEDDAEDSGSIDHYKELEDFINFVMESKENLYKFLFCDNSFIIIDNDNNYNRPIETKVLNAIRNEPYNIFYKMN